MANPAQPVGHSPAVRLLAAHGRLVTSRPLVLARGLERRVRRRPAWTLWPDAIEPSEGVDAGARLPAAFMRRDRGEDGPTRHPLVVAARRALGPRTWSLLRAGALLEPTSPGLALRAVEHVLGSGEGWHLALLSPSGSQLAKAICFAFRPGAPEPEAIVLAMADPGCSGRLRYEVDHVEALRERLAASPRLADALPLPPLGRLEPPGDLAVVARPDPLAGRTGDVVPPERAPAWDWLRAFHAATVTASTPFTDAEADRVVADAEAAWAPLGGDAVRRAGHVARRAVAPAVGATAPVCAVHGDFWWGNIAHDAGRMRVFDWEWGRLEGRPLFDVWTYELAATEQAVRAGHGPATAATVVEALRRVEAEAEARDLDRALAAAALPAAVAELTLRVRRATGVAGPAEPALLALLEPIEQALGASRA